MSGIALIADPPEIGIIESTSTRLDFSALLDTSQVKSKQSKKKLAKVKHNTPQLQERTVAEKLPERIPPAVETKASNSPLPVGVKFSVKKMTRS